MVFIHATRMASKGLNSDGTKRKGKDRAKKDHQFGKGTPERNPRRLARVRALPCMVCHLPGPSEVDHIRTRGAGGGDESSNVWPLCCFHHRLRHRIGLRQFVIMYRLPVSWDAGPPKRTDV